MIDETQEKLLELLEEMTTGEIGEEAEGADNDDRMLWL